ncbi:unnamed protein product (macronuclear) [Paramecium tetraurelia]|uniref:PDZ domain-containing protein n=1 Tax=Paramecium tetraurelia TaxID=5888 RepID=A0DZF4_PARTE|nr:uncharacterized protein GSPATT00021588001 [Paramecium tetraurelia]CAK88421.1 unnamed protein product [Paramecium tetraurelia]|eukprot:XP_001455818.1 hypothetical protein (macronuclear) [Paramecium tetraurelia strain d4-2]
MKMKDFCHATQLQKNKIDQGIKKRSHYLNLDNLRMRKLASRMQVIFWQGYLRIVETGSLSDIIKQRANMSLMVHLTSINGKNLNQLELLDSLQKNEGKIKRIKQLNEGQISDVWINRQLQKFPQSKQTVTEISRECRIKQYRNEQVFEQEQPVKEIIQGQR